MSALSPTRRGACPTLTAPMRTGDGLLARLRVSGARLTPAQLADIARLAARHGNGLVEVSARGNLQVRGLTETSAPLFASAILALVDIEDGLVVEHSPIAGDDPAEIADARPLAEGIRDAARTFSGRLGPKVSVVIDSGGQVSLSVLKADVRLVAVAGDRWAVSLGGGRAQVMDGDGAVAATLALLGALAAMGPDARAVDLFPVRGSGLSPSQAAPPREAEGAASSLTLDMVSNTGPTPSPLRGGLGWGVSTLKLHHGYTVPIALPFGAADAEMLIALAGAAAHAGVEAIRLAPHHTMLLDDAPAELLDQAAALGFITRFDDPRSRISACIGNVGCASGHIAARHVAARLAPGVPAESTLHVSGCAKGCAHPRPAHYTLVGRPDGIGLVMDGRAGDTPQHILDEAGIVAALAARRDAR